LVLIFKKTVIFNFQSKKFSTFSLSFLSRGFAFDLHFRSEDESDYELSDHEINKLLIVTQSTSQSSRYPKHEGYDRTGDWTTRVKITQDLEQVISDGLNYYEEGLWSEQEWVSAVICMFLTQ
jgi:hypothetical protein